MVRMQQPLTFSTTDIDTSMCTPETYGSFFMPISELFDRTKSRHYKQHQEMNAPIGGKNFSPAATVRSYTPQFHVTPQTSSGFTRCASSRLGSNPINPRNVRSRNTVSSNRATDLQVNNPVAMSIPTAHATVATSPDSNSSFISMGDASEEDV